MKLEKERKHKNEKIQFYEIRRESTIDIYDDRRMSKAPQTLFGKRLREARLKASIPQDRLGVLIGIDEMSSSARISRYETGIHAPPFEIARRLAEALGVPTAYFYCEEEILAELLLVLSKKSPDKLYELKSQLA